jgi:hypothetical protein
MASTNSSMMANLEYMAQSGPTSDDQPVFKWSDAKANACSDPVKFKHHGHPDAWNFAAIHVTWTKTNK